VRDEVAKSSIGEKKYEKYMPFCLRFSFSILFLNLLGTHYHSCPGGANVTGNLAITMSLALLTFVIHMFSATKIIGISISPCRACRCGCCSVLTPIEILGVFLRPFVLMIRLFANMLAGTIIALSFLLAHISFLAR
jgi:F-type H+-transporting ATPase subunit a